MPKPDGGVWNVQEGAIGNIPGFTGTLLSDWLSNHTSANISQIDPSLLAQLQSSFNQIDPANQQALLSGFQLQMNLGAFDSENIAQLTSHLQGDFATNLSGYLPQEQQSSFLQNMEGRVAQTPAAQPTPPAPPYHPPTAPQPPKVAPPHPHSPAAAGAGAGGPGIGGGGAGHNPPDAPKPDTTSNTAGEYGTFAKQAKDLFGPSGLAPYGEQTPWGERFLSDELTATQATGGAAGGPGDPYAQNWTKGGGMTGFTFNGVSGADIQKVLGMAEKWSALTGWKYFPPAQVIQILAGQNDLSQQSANEQFWQQLPQNIQQKVPGVEFGQDPNQFLKTTNQFQEAYAHWTGATDLSPAIINDFLKKGGGEFDAQMFDQWVQNDPATRERAPWMTRGLGYQDWQRHMADPGNIHALQLRFGTDPAAQNQTNFLTDFMKPEFQTTSHGGPITPQQRGTATFTSRQASATGLQSEVR